MSAATSAATGLRSVYRSPLNFFANGPGYDAATVAGYFRDVQSCMSALGWKYYPDRPAPADPPARVVDLVKYRSLYGYATKPAVSPSNDPNVAYAESLSTSQPPVYYHDLDGEGGTGCQPQALDAVRASLPSSDPAFAEQLAASERAVQQSPRFKAAYDEWAGCVEQNGYTASVVAAAASIGVPAQTGGATSPPPAATSATTVAAPSGVSQVREADVDMSCEVEYLIPVQQQLEVAQIQRLAELFPQYSARAAAVLSNSATS